MQGFLKRAFPDWLLIIVGSKIATSFFLLSMGFG
jgi:hypothetical protein